MQIFHTCLYYHNLLFIHVWCNPAFTSDVRATAWLSVLDGEHPTVLANEIDTDVKPTENILFYRFKYFFHMMITCEHCQGPEYVYFTIIFTIGHCQIFIFKKPRFDWIFQN